MRCLIQSRRISERKQRFELILFAAKRELLENGYHNTSMNSVAKRTGLGKASLYYYFKNKEELMCRVALALLEKLNRALHIELKGEKNFRGSLDVFANVTLGFLMDNMDFFNTFDHEQKTFFTKVPKHINMVRRRAKRSMSLFEKGMQERMNASKIQGDPAILFDMVFSLLVGYSHKYRQMHWEWKMLSDRLTHALNVITQGMTIVEKSNITSNEALWEKPIWDKYKIKSI